MCSTRYWPPQTDFQLIKKFRPGHMYVRRAAVLISEAKTQRPPTAWMENAGLIPPCYNLAGFTGLPDIPPFKIPELHGLNICT